MRSPARVSTLTMTRSLSGPVNGLPDRASELLTTRNCMRNRSRHLTFPVAHQTGWWNDEDAADQPASQHLTHVDPGHDRLAGAGVVSQQEFGEVTAEAYACRRPVADGAVDR